jgi:putative tricarboxylic transport membrane protein
LWAKVITAPQSVILSAALVMCLVGAYLASGSMFGVWVLIAFALVGYAMTSFGYPVVVFIIAFFLGPRFELSLVQTLIVTRNDLTRVVEHPIALAFVLLSVVAIVLSARRNFNRPSARP